MRLLLAHAPSPIVREFCRRGIELISCNSSCSFNVIDELPAAFAPRQRTMNVSGRKKIHWGAIRTIRSRILEFQPDVIHAFIPSSLAWSCLATIGLKSPPKIVSYRGITRIPNRWDPADWITYLSPRVAMHACESHAVRDAMVQGGIPAERCEVTYNCMWESHSSKSRCDWRDAWGIPEEEVVFGTVGTIRPVKGVDLLIQAAEGLPRSLPWRIVLIGSIHDERVRELLRTSPVRDRILAIGESAEAVSAMQGFDVFVMPSRSEGLCRALIEAGTVGICPIVSDAGGMKELVRHGVDGRVFPKEDVAGLQQAMREALGNPALRRRYADSVARHVPSLCSADRVADRMLDLYARVICKS